jgi:homocysteine S-methyltransferase
MAIDATKTWPFPPGADVLITDGGLATELEARGHDLSDALWSARLLADAPEEIIAAHVAFFRAGAVIATTASYQASFGGFAARGIGRRETAGLLTRSVRLAQAARTRIATEDDATAGHVTPRLVAASVGPYGATLADGAEYRGRYGLSVASLAAWHKPRMEVLASADADLLAIETVPDTDEAEALTTVLAQLAVPAWLSYTVDGDRTRAGQPLTDAFAIAAASPQVVAVGVNCCSPADVAPAIMTARQVTDKPVIVYPNSGEGWDARRRAWTGGSEFKAVAARRWAAAGASAIGGCCRVGPADIAATARALSGGRGREGRDRS